MKSVYKKPDGRWYVSYRDEAGKQRTKTFGRGDEWRKKAEAEALRIQADRLEGNRPKPAGPQVYFKDLAQSYLDDRRANGASASYIQDVINLNNNHLRHLLNFKPVNDLTYQDVMSRISEHYKGRSLATRQRYLGYLRAIFLFGTKHKITQNNPLDTWKKREETPRRSMLTVEDVKKIHAVAADHLKWGIEVQWNIGTRPGQSELLALKWRDVDFEKGIIHVYGRKTKAFRSIPVSDQFLKRLQEKQAEAKTEFLIEYQGEPVHKFRSSFRTACTRAGIPYPCRMYDLRHLYATVMLSGGADLAAVSKLLGHSNTQQTANTYYELLKGEKERAVSLLPSIFDQEEKLSPEPGGEEEVVQPGKVIPLRANSPQRAKCYPLCYPPSSKPNRGERI